MDNSFNWRDLDGYEVTVVYQNMSCRESSLCSGALHPDAVLQDEQCLMTAKKSYSCELQKYHNK